MSPKIVLGLVVLWSAIGAQRASACTYGRGSVSAILPEGPTHPANAAALLIGEEMDAGLEATVDGAPVSVRVDPALSTRWSELGYSRMALRLDPEPAPGQTVRLFGEACPWSGRRCPVDVTWTASAPDLEPPPAVEWSWELTWSGEGESCEDPGYYGCGRPFEVGGGTVTIGAAPTASPHDLAVVRAVRESSSLVDPSRVLLPLGEEATAHFTLARWQAGGCPIDPSEVCLRLVTLDLAGNSSGPVERCGVAADIGGAARTGGCAVARTSARRNPTRAPWWLLLAVAGVRRRRACPAAATAPQPPGG